MEFNTNQFLLADDDDQEEDTYRESNNSPKLINIKNDNSFIKELNSYFKLDNFYMHIQ